MIKLEKFIWGLLFLMYMEEVKDGTAQYTAFVQQRYGWQVHPSPALEFPSIHPRYNDLEQGLQNLRAHATNTLLILDEFGTDHESRRAFIESIDAELPGFQNWYDNHSKLRGNKLFGVVGLMEMYWERVADHMPEDHPLHTTIPTLKGLMWEYITLPTAAKVQAARRVDDTIVQFFHSLAA